MSAIQFNLLPDVKIEYLKARRSRRLVLSIAVIASIVSVLLLVSLLSFDAFQKKHLNDLNRDINSESSTLQNEPQINKILTVQNQLESLTQLHSTKPATSRLFDYLNEVTPAQVDINNFAVDFNQHTITVTGTADTLSTTNQYVDTLKFTTYSVKGTPGSPMAFSDVVLSSFGLASGTSQSAQASNQKASYTLTLSYDPTIFDISKTITLSVPPNKITTRSALEQPTDLFVKTPDNPTPSGGQ